MIQCHETHNFRPIFLQFNLSHYSCEIDLEKFKTVSGLLAKKEKLRLECHLRTMEKSRILCTDLMRMLFTGSGNTVYEKNRKPPYFRN